MSFQFCCWGVSVHVCAYVWQPEMNFRCCFSIAITFFTETGTLTGTQSSLSRLFWMASEPPGLYTPISSNPHRTGVTNACHHAGLLMWVPGIRHFLRHGMQALCQRAICPVSGLGFWHRILLYCSQMAYNSLCRPCCPQTCGNPPAVTLWAKVPGE